MEEIRARVQRAKGMPPALPSMLLVRERLVERLDALAAPESDSRLGVVTAPAGFGKTTLLATWTARAVADGSVVAWCGVDESDADTYRFWSAVVAALIAAHPSLASDLDSLPAPRRPGHRTFLADLAAALEGAEVVLVLENLHDLIDAGVLVDLNLFLEHLPPGVTVVLTSRSDPPLPILQKTKMAGNLTQLRTADLAFTEEETTRWCRDLSPEQARAVWQRTEGWPAMVRLMEIAVRTNDLSADEASQDLGLADYLFGETFRHQPDVTQDVMMLTSVPDTVPLDLARELTGHDDAGELLEGAIQRSGLVSRSIDRDTDAAVYRLHPMLRAYLHGELQRRDHAAERRAQQTAARWCLSADRPLAAVRHASASGDPAFQEQVVRAAGPGLINAGEAERLLAALDSHGRRRGDELAWTSLIRGAALLDEGHLHEAAVELRHVGAAASSAEADDSDLAVALQAADAHLQRRRGALVDLDRVPRPLVSEDADLRLMLAAQRGPALAWEGDLDAAEAELCEGIDLARGLDRMAALVDCLAFEGGVHSARSQFEPMRACVQEALDLGEAHGWADTPRMAYPHLLRAWAAYQALDDDVARAHVARAVELVEPSADPTIWMSVEGLRTGLAYDRPHDEGSATRAADATALHDVLVGLPGREVAPSLIVYAALADARMSLQTQRHTRVPEIVDLLQSRLGPCGEVDLIRASHLEATGRRAEARALLASVTAKPESLVVPLAEAEAAILGAVLAYADADLFNATALARQALDVTQRLHGFRPLVDAGAAFHDLLRSGIGRWGVHEALVATVLARGAAPTAASTIALTARELEVLRELPNLNTVDEIAEALFVSVNTVKTHLRSLYRKLQVGSRRAAVAEARRLGLL